MRHDVVMQFRASSALRDEIAAEADRFDQTLSSYLRGAALAHKRHRDPALDRQILSELIALRDEVRRLGTNVNQIAKKMHAEGVLPQEAARAMAAVQQLQDEASSALKDFAESWA